MVGTVLLSRASAFALLMSVAVAAGPQRLDCGAEAIREEGACLLILFDTEVLVTASDAGSPNILTVRTVDGDASASEEIDGTAYRAEIADLDSDQRPEVYIAVASAGSGSYGSLVAYVIEEDPSLSRILVPELGEDEAASDGYMGHDEFAVVETSLIRRFPLYAPGDVNAEPSGGTRNVVYKLQKSAGQWQLTRSRITDY